MMRLSLVLLAAIGTLLSQEVRRPEVAPSPPEAARAAPQDQGAIEGIVLNVTTNQPVNKAHVMVIRRGERGPLPVATTGPDGKFKLSGLDPGSYNISATRNGFSRSAGAMERQQTLILSAGQTVRDVRIKLTPAAVISGRVVDEDGEPVLNARVQALRYRYFRGKRQLMPAGGAGTDDLGNFRMHSLAPGQYFVKVSQSDPRMFGTVSSGGRPDGDDQSYVAVYYPGVLDPGQAAPVALRPGDDVRGMDFRLTRAPTLRIRGRVTNPPASGSRGGVMILAAPQSSAFDPIYRQAGADGTFEVRGLVPGSYVLSAFATEEQNRLGARRMVQVANADVEGIELTLHSAVEAPGTVTFEGGAGSTQPDFKGLRITPEQDVPGPMGFTTAGPNSEGAFVLKVADGEYRLNLGGLPDGAYLKSIKAGEADVLANGFTVSEGSPPGALSIVISLEGGTVDGTVRGDGEKPAAGVAVVLAPKERNRYERYKSAVTDQAGRYSINGVAPGDYQAFAWQDVEQGAWLDPAFLEQNKDKGKSVAVQEKTRAPLDLTLIPAAS